jgi:hypothetical protein
VTVVHVVLPFTDVSSTIWEDHGSHAVLFVIFVFAFVDLTVVPGVLAPPVVVAVLEGPSITAS